MLGGTVDGLGENWGTRETELRTLSIRRGQMAVFAPEALSDTLYPNQSSLQVSDGVSLGISWLLVRVSATY